MLPSQKREEGNLLPCNSIAVARAIVKENIADVFGNAQAIAGLQGLLQAETGGTVVLDSQTETSVRFLLPNDAEVQIYLSAAGGAQVVARSYDRSQQRLLDRLKGQVADYLAAVAPFATRQKLATTIKAQGRVQSDVTDPRSGVQVITLTV
jgi:hypothetical protein